jgi:MFS family permease
VATAISFLMGASLFSSMLLVPLYYQQVKHASALSSGLLLAPQAVGTVIATVAAGRVNDRFSPRAFMLTGLTLAILGTFAFTQVAAEPAGWLLTGSLVLRGFGMGLTMTQSMVAVYGSVERHQVPRASSAMNVLNRIGGSLGTAILVVVLQDGLRHDPTHQAAAFGTTFWCSDFRCSRSSPPLCFPGTTESSPSPGTVCYGTPATGDACVSTW